MPGRPNILAVMFRFGRRTASYFQHADREDDDVEGGSIRVVIARDHKDVARAAGGVSVADGVFVVTLVPLKTSFVAPPSLPLQFQLAPSSASPPPRRVSAGCFQLNGCEITTGADRVRQGQDHTHHT